MRRTAETNERPPLALNIHKRALRLSVHLTFRQVIDKEYLDTSILTCQA